MTPYPWPSSCLPLVQERRPATAPDPRGDVLLALWLELQAFRHCPRPAPLGLFPPRNRQPSAAPFGLAGSANQTVSPICHRTCCPRHRHTCWLGLICHHVITTTAYITGAGCSERPCALGRASLAHLALQLIGCHWCLQCARRGFSLRQGHKVASRCHGERFSPGQPPRWWVHRLNLSCLVVNHYGSSVLSQLGHLLF